MYKIINYITNLYISIKNLGLYSTILLFFIPKKNLNKIYIKEFRRYLYYRKNGDYGAISHLYKWFYKIDDTNSKSKIDVIFDIGANIGVETLRLNKIYPKAQIIAVEADPSNFEVLKKNVENIQNIKIYNLAVYNKKTFLNFYNPSGYMQKKSSNYYEQFKINKNKNKNDNTTFNVESTTIDDLLLRNNYNRVNILKLDVEGAEEYIFDDSAIKWISKVDSIIYDCTDDDKHQKGITQNIFNQINKNGLYFKTLISGENLVLFDSNSKYELERHIFLNLRYINR